MMNRRHFFTTLLSVPALLTCRLNAQIKDPSIEWERCKNNPVYFIENYCKWDDGETRTLYEWQEDAIRKYQDKSVIVASSRQSGKNVVCCGLALHRMLFFTDVRVGLMSINHRCSRMFLHTIKGLHSRLPAWMTQNADHQEATDTNLVLTNNNVLRVMSPASLPGNHFTDLILDEAAGFRQELIDSALLTLNPKTGKFFMISTPYGDGNSAFHRMFYSTKNDPKVNRMWVTWRAVPGRDSEWVSKMKANIGEDSFNREYCVSF
jgi:hypothetical protein